MKLNFLGAIGEVTGSKFLITTKKYFFVHKKNVHLYFLE